MIDNVMAFPWESVRLAGIVSAVCAAIAAICVAILIAIVSAVMAHPWMVGVPVAIAGLMGAWAVMMSGA